ncbi:MAG: hypothetical protein ACRC7C_06440, partial [Beijerinckiaceae bacterium]
MTTVRFRLGRSRIVHRVFLLGSIGLAGLIGVGWAYTYGERRLQLANERLEAAEKIDIARSDISSASLKLRLIEKDYLKTRDANLVARHNEAAVRVVADLEMIRKGGEAQGIAEIGDKIDALASALSRYRQQFGRMAQAMDKLGLSEKLGLEGKLRDAVHAVETEIAKYDHMMLENLMLQMRRHEKDFMLRRDPVYLDRIGARVVAFKAELAAARMPDAIKANIGSLIETYHDAMKSWVDSSLDVAMAQDGAQSAYVMVEPLLADAGRAIEAFRDETAKALASDQAFVKSLMLSVFAACVLAVIGLGTFVGRSISAPLARMKDAVAAMGDGHHEGAISGAERSDELG